MVTAELFLKFHYPELKELTLTFLTLNSSIFTFSVIFAEKLVHLDKRKSKGNISLYASWALFLIALILGGIGLMRLLVAADFAQGGDLILGDFFYGSKPDDFFDYIYTVYVQLFIAGVSFVGALILLAVSAFYKIILSR
jgi:hypothetical protein